MDISPTPDVRVQVVPIVQEKGKKSLRFIGFFVFFRDVPKLIIR
jgi:hypothetical protein